MLVARDVREQLSGIALTTAATSVTTQIGGNLSTHVGAACIEITGGSKLESTGGLKIETTAVSVVQTTQGYSIAAAGAATMTLAATQRLRIQGSHEYSAQGAVAMTVGRCRVRATEKIVLKCGLAEVVIDGSGIAIKAPLGSTIQGTSRILLEHAALRPV
jgi:hypothetical protein